MRPNRELTPDQVYWSNLIKPIIGVDHVEAAEMAPGDDDDFADFLQREMERADATERKAVPTRVRGLRIGYPH